VLPALPQSDALHTLSCPLLPPASAAAGVPQVGLPSRDTGAVYSYASGWPTPLNRQLLCTPPEALPNAVLKLQTYR
jgi:hypothetical protein